MTSSRIQGSHTTAHAAACGAAGNAAGTPARPPAPVRPDGLTARAGTGPRTRPPSSLAPIEQLPDVILAQILRRTLPAHTPHAFVGTIAAIRTLPRVLRDGPPEDTELRSTCRALSRLGQAVTQWVDGAIRLTHEDIGGLGQVLGLLSPGRRARVAQGAIHMPDDRARARAIGGLGPGLAQLPQALRDELFDAAALLPGDDDKARAFGGLAAGLEFLEPTRAGTLVADVLALPADMANKGQAITGLAPKLAQLPPDQRPGLVQAAIHLANEEMRARALAAVAAEWAHLEQPEQRAVMGAVQRLPAGPLQAEALFGVCRATADFLNDTQLDGVARQALDMDDAAARAQMLRALGAVLARLAENRRTEVFDAAMQLNTPGKFLALRGLGAGLASLTTAQQQSLVQETVNLPDRPEKALAIASLAAAAAHLDEAQRGRLVEAALNLPEAAWRGEAIGSLGACLEHLRPDQRQALMAAAMACTCLDQKARAIAGLAQGWQHLT
jgi:hypothetical protein